MTRALLTSAVVLLTAACLTTVNRPKVVLRADAPALESRASGCNVEVIEDGDTLTRPHQDIADVELVWSRAQIAQQGPDAAIQTLRQSACEHGAFFVHNMRALSTATADGGLIYEATFAVLLDDAGKPLNLKPAPAPPGGSAPDAGSGTVPP